MDFKIIKICRLTKFNLINLRKLLIIIIISIDDFLNTGIQVIGLELWNLLERGTRYALASFILLPYRHLVYQIVLYFTDWSYSLLQFVCSSKSISVFVFLYTDDCLSTNLDYLFLLSCS